jgi:hypothetical integral membrane protein (TIGR02206 family)
MYLNFFVHAKELESSGAHNPFGLKYVITLLVLAAIYVLLIKIYKKLSPKIKRRFMLVLAAVMPLIELSRQTWAALSGYYDITRDLPFQMCRLMLFMYSAAIISNSKTLKTACYGFGLPGAFLAYAFPNVTLYPLLSFEYLRYMTAHLLLAAVPVMWVAGDGFRPEFKAVKWLFPVLFLTAASVFAINVLLGSNYIYVNRLPEHVDIYIAQPWYTLAIFAFMNAVVLITMLPFVKSKPSL